MQGAISFQLKDEITIQENAKYNAGDREYTGDPYTVYKDFKTNNNVKISDLGKNLKTSEKQKIKNKLKKEGLVFRTDEIYEVIRKSVETGFLGQSVLEAIIKEQAVQYNKDRDSWFGYEDIRYNNFGVSVKNFLDAAPSLLSSVNSLHDALDRIIYSLYNRKKIEDIKEILKNKTSNYIDTIDNLANTDIGQLLNTLNA